MDHSIFALAAPVLGTAIQGVRQLTSVAVEPFAAVLQSAQNKSSQETGVYAEALQELSHQSSELAAELHSRLQNVLQASGIQLDEPIRLRLSAFDNQIEVVDPHPERALLEAAINKDSNLVRDFQKYSAIAGYFTTDRDALLVLNPNNPLEV